MFILCTEQVRGCWKPPAVTQTMSSNLNKYVFSPVNSDNYICWSPGVILQPVVDQRKNNNCPKFSMVSAVLRSRRPTFYGVIQCPNCGTSCSSGAKICRRCSTPIHKEIPACHSGVV